MKIFFIIGLLISTFLLSACLKQKSDLEITTLVPKNIGSWTLETGESLIQSSGSVENLKKVTINDLKEIGCLWYEECTPIYKDKEEKYLYYQDQEWEFKVMTQWVNKVMDLIDVKSFKILNHPSIDNAGITIGYSKDLNNIYHHINTFYSNEDSLKALVWVDINTFEIIRCDYPYWCYFKDKNGVYYDSDELIKLQWVDISTFDIFSFVYTRDKNSVYLMWKKIPEADPNTFKVFSTGPVLDNKAKDDKYVYCEDKVCFPWADAKTFQLLWLDSWLTKDKDHVYFGDEVFEWPDVETFQNVGENGFAKDKNHVYDFNSKSGEIIEWIDTQRATEEIILNTVKKSIK